MLGNYIQQLLPTTVAPMEIWNNLQLVQLLPLYTHNKQYLNTSHYTYRESRNNMPKEYVICIKNITFN
jgi:hypothetical protein